MKKLLSLLLLFLAYSNLHASPQASEILIMGKDTIYIYQFPFQGISEEVEASFLKNLHDSNHGGFISTGLWRGFRGVWEIIDDKLYLVDLKNVNNPREILMNTFKDHYIEGKVLADWFSSTLILPKGDVLRWDGIFGRTYYREEHLLFQNGCLVGKENISNYLPVKDGISRRQNPFQDYSSKPLAEVIYQTIKNLNWKKLSDKYRCDDEYLITIGANGRISEVKFIDEEFSCKKCTRILKRELKNLQFDIIKWNGEPYEEQVRLELFYDEETKELENWSE